jgi:RNA recognition motif-containing protein
MGHKLYVGGLSFETTEAELRALFEQAGKVESAVVVTDRFSGRSKGFGFVEMSTNAEAKQAISELNGKVLGERTITVDEARPPRQSGGRPGGPGGRSGGSSYGRGRW